MTPSLSALRVLVIDDNPQMREVIGAVLTGAGVGRVCYAADGVAGLDALCEGPIDVIYVDLEMPVMNGLDFIATVRGLRPPLRYLPVIMLTGHSFGPSVLAARDAGVTEFLTKPVTAKSILARLEAVIFRPRPFVVAPTYVGPDRRRGARRKYAGPWRRRTDRRDTVAIEI